MALPAPDTRRSMGASRFHWDLGRLNLERAPKHSPSALQRPRSRLTKHGRGTRPCRDEAQAVHGESGARAGAEGKRTYSFSCGQMLRRSLEQMERSPASGRRALRASPLGLGPAAPHSSASRALARIASQGTARETAPEAGSACAGRSWAGSPSGSRATVSGVDALSDSRPSPRGSVANSVAAPPPPPEVRPHIGRHARSFRKAGVARRQRGPLRVVQPRRLRGPIAGASLHAKALATSDYAGRSIDAKRTTRSRSPRRSAAEDWRPRSWCTAAARPRTFRASARRERSWATGRYGACASACPRLLASKCGCPRLRRGCAT
jgi:hypothetical protein